MWILDDVWIKNLFSHKETYYKFLQNKAVLIYGENKSDSGADSNGSGKSGLLEGITLATTGGTCREVDKEQFIMDFEDDCEVKLNLSNKFIGKKLTIHRQYFRGSKSAKIWIYEDDILNDQITSVLEANSRIYDLIGISREDLLNYFIIGQSSNHSFFTATDGEKKNIIARFTNAEVIDKAIAKLNLMKKNLAERKSLSEKDIEKTKNFIEFNKENLEYEEQHWKENLLKEINDLVKDTEEKESEVKELNDDIESRCKDDKDIEKKINEYKALLTPTDKIEKKIEELENGIEELQTEIKQANKLEAELNRELGGKVKCPGCDKEFIPDSQYTPKNIIDLIKNCEELRKESNEIIETSRKKIKKQREQLELSLSVKRSIDENQSKRNTNASKIHLKRKELKEVEEKLAKYKEKLVVKRTELKSNSKILTLKAEISKHQEILRSQEKDFEKFIEEEEGYEYWINNFGKKGFATYLANQSIKTIEGVVNSNLKRMNTNLSVLIQGYTLLKTGEVREKINIFILKNGVTQGVYQRYSGGEKGRINIAGIIGLQKLINLSAKNGGLNFLGLDEVFDEVDGTGQKEILSILNNTGITTLVVSHKNNSIGAINELKIEKQNGVSFIVK